MVSMLLLTTAAFTRALVTSQHQAPSQPAPLVIRGR
jgi:hypothetical protein